MAGLAVIVGATLRHFISKPDSAVESAAAQSVTPTPVSATTVPDQFPTIQAAIDNTPAGQTITLKPGVYHESVTLKDGIGLVGGAGGECRLSPSDGAPAVIFARGVRGCSLENLVLDGSQAPARSHASTELRSPMPK
jgi:hypothetical protein